MTRPAWFPKWLWGFLFEEDESPLNATQLPPEPQVTARLKASSKSFGEGSRLLKDVDIVKQAPLRAPRPVERSDAAQRRADDEQRIKRQRQLAEDEARRRRLDDEHVSTSSTSAVFQQQQYANLAVLNLLVQQDERPLCEAPAPAPATMPDRDPEPSCPDRYADRASEPSYSYSSPAPDPSPSPSYSYSSPSPEPSPSPSPSDSGSSSFSGD